MDYNIKGYKTFTRIINSWVGGNWNQYRLEPKKCIRLTNYIIKHGEHFNKLYRLTNYDLDPVRNKDIGDSITLNVCSTSDMSLVDFSDNIPKMISNLPDLALKPKANRCIYEIKDAIGIPTYRYLNKLNSKYFEYQKEVIIFGKFKITNIEHYVNFTLITLEYESNGINNLKTVAKQIIENVISYDKYFQKYKEQVREIRSNPELSTDEEDELVDKLKKKFKKRESKLYEKTISY